MIGTVVSHYRVDELIGEGGMGTVYKGTDTTLDRPVALKAIHPQLIKDPALRERFENEARIQAKLSHPNIISVYDFAADEGIIVMEFVPGKGLDEVIAHDTGPIPYDKCLDIFGQVLRALGYAHDYRDNMAPNGIVHRDIKPSNIMVLRQGSQTIAKVTDFGIAKIVGDTKQRTATGAKMGTLWYMSPEQLTSTKNVGPVSDIYSLGVTLYQMATGRVPFEDGSEYEIMDQIIRAEPPPPSHFYPGISGAFETVIMRAMAKDPGARFQSCDDFLEALKAAGAGRAEGAYTPPPPPSQPAQAPTPPPYQPPARQHGATPPPGQPPGQPAGYPPGGQYPAPGTGPGAAPNTGPGGTAMFQTDPAAQGGGYPPGGHTPGGGYPPSGAYPPSAGGGSYPPGTYPPSQGQDQKKGFPWLAVIIPVVLLGLVALVGGGGLFIYALGGPDSSSNDIVTGTVPAVPDPPADPFTPAEPEPPAYIPPEPDPPRPADTSAADRSAIESALQAHARSVNSENPHAYAEGFADYTDWFGKSKSRSDIRSLMAKSFGKYDYMEMSVYDIHVTLHNSFSAEADFTKYWKYLRYSGKDFCGEVQASYGFRKVGGRWLITSVEDRNVNWVEKNNCE